MKPAKSINPIFWTAAFMLLALLPVLAARDYSPSNELRYLNIVDEALASGHFFAFTCNGAPYADKPPFYFWLMMLCRLVFGRHCIFALSLLSFIPSLAVIFIMDSWLCSVRPAAGVRTRLAASMMTATCVLYLGMSIIVRMDMLMIMWIVLSLRTFWKMDHGGGPQYSWMLPFFMFMGLFTKGPVGLLLPVVSIAVFLTASHRAGEAGRFLGLKTWGVLAFLCSLWFTAAWLEGGSPYLKNLLFHQTLDRAVNAFHHKQPFWYYGKEIWGILAPWCVTLVPALLLSLSSWRKGVSDEERFFGIVAASCVVMLSLFSSKLAVYLGPMIPFTVYLLPLFFRRTGWRKWISVTLSVPCVILLIGGLGLVSAVMLGIFDCSLFLLDKYPFLKSMPALPAGLILLAGGVHALRNMPGRDWEMPVISASAALILSVSVMSMSLDSINDFIGYRNLCRLVPERTQVYTFRVKRAENLNVYLGHGVNDFEEDAEAFLKASPKDGVLLVKDSALRDYLQLAGYLEGVKSSRCGKYSAYFLSERVSDSESATK